MVTSGGGYFPLPLIEKRYGFRHSRVNVLGVEIAASRQSCGFGLRRESAYNP
jgi:hypothetical protein